MRKYLLVLVALLLLLPVFIFAEGQQEVETPGVTDDKIVVGYTMPMSGPLGYIGSQTAYAVEGVFRKYNEQGGINGRQLELVIYDSGMDAAQALANYRKLILEDKVFCVLFGFGTFVRPAYPFFEEQKVPWLFPMAPPNDMIFPAKKYLFSLFPTTATQMKTEAEWVIQEGKYKRIACIYGDSASGKTGLEGLREALEGSEVEIVAAEAIKNDATSAAVQVAKIAPSDPDLVMIFGMVHQPAVVSVKEIKKNRLDTDIILGQPITGAITLRLLEGTDVEGLYGSYWGTLQFNPDKPEQAARSTPEMRALTELLLEYYPDDYDANNIGGAVEHGLSVELFIEALKRAGKNLTREGLIEAMEGFDNYPSGKGSPATFSPTRREGVAGGIIAQAQNGQWIQVSDWIDVEVE